MPTLITGAAGFIGAKIAFELASRGDEVIGVDNINYYYDVGLKYARLRECSVDVEGTSTLFPNYRFVRMSIDDIAEETIRALDCCFRAEDCPGGVPCKIYNIGCGHPVHLMDFIRELELAYGRCAEKIFMPMQSGDVYQTYAGSCGIVSSCPSVW